MKCPGQDSRYWKPGAIFETRCPHCGEPLEFFKDDTTRKCKNCGRRILNPQMDFGCASYCQYAEQCLGDLPPELIAGRDDLLKDRVAVEVKKFFGKDFRRIGRATKAARYAERIGKAEKGNLAVILPAAYLLDLGAAEAEEPRTDPQQSSGATKAQEILKGLGAREELIREVSEIVARRRRPEEMESVNEKVVFDADQIVKGEEAVKAGQTDPNRLVEGLEGVLLTESGRRLAREVLLGKTEP
jgi:hypothetical protein